MFRFAHPELLYLLIVIPLLIVFYVVMIRRKKKAIAEFGNPELLGPLMPLLSFKRGTWKFVMLMLALLFVIVGVAGPQFGSKLQQVKKKGVELMIALDVSNSMMAQDIKPSRLEKAKMAISRMVEKLSNDKIGFEYQYGYRTGTGDGYRECDRSGRPVVYTGNRDVQSDYCHHGRRKPSG